MSSMLSMGHRSRAHAQIVSDEKKISTTNPPSALRQQR